MLWINKCFESAMCRRVKYLTLLLQGTFAQVCSRLFRWTPKVFKWRRLCWFCCKFFLTCCRKWLTLRPDRRPDHDLFFKPFQTSPTRAIFDFTIMLLGIGLQREIWDTLLSTVRWKSAMGIQLQSFTGARGMSNALKIGGNVLHSITTHKRALWVS